MPSDSNGIYSLPAGYLAVTGTTILASQHNPPLEDIEAGLTARLMRSGVAPMTGVLRGYVGSAAAPGFTFDGFTTRGLYKTTDGVGIAVGGALVAEVTATGIKLTGTLAGASGPLTTDKLLVPDGTKTAPAYSWTSDTDTGFYRIGANNIGISCGDTKIFDITTSGATITGGLTVSNGLTVSAGSVSLPAGSIANAALASPGGCVLIKTVTASSSATIDFQNGVSSVVFDGTYRKYVFELQNLVPATDDTGLVMLFGTGATPTYQTASYYTDSAGTTNANAAANPVGYANVAEFRLTYIAGGGNAVDNTAANGGITGTVEIVNPTASIIPRALFRVGYPSSSTVNVFIAGGGHYASATAITAVRFKFSSGNIASGSITLYGYT